MWKRFKEGLQSAEVTIGILLSLGGLLWAGGHAWGKQVAKDEMHDAILARHEVSLLVIQQIRDDVQEIKGLLGLHTRGKAWGK